MKEHRGKLSEPLIIHLNVLLLIRNFNIRILAL